MTPIALVGKRLLAKSPILPPPAIQKDTSRRQTLYLFVLSAATVVLPWLVVYHLVPPSRRPLPSTEGPLLDILMLSFPRPVPIDTSTAIISTTVRSFLPYLSPAVSLSLFTHSVNHEALDLVHQKSPGVSLHIDTDSHPADIDGHYLHLAEAFRWMSSESGTHGEWIMLVEDDFPICNGDQGWSVIATAVNMLETDRRLGHIRSGFIGTGGRQVNSRRMAIIQKGKAYLSAVSSFTDPTYPPWPFSYDPSPLPRLPYIPTSLDEHQTSSFTIVSWAGSTHSASDTKQISGNSSSRVDWY